METDKKDKLIIGLVIVIVILLAKNFNNKNNDLVIDRNDISSQYFLDEEAIEDTSVKQINKVHISGEINNPGVYEIDEDERLEDLVNKAGGLTDEANLDAINLSMLVEDQMRIIIPNINNAENNNNLDPVVDSTSDPKININTASKEELMTLPNIGEKRADAIIEYREENKFEKIEDIKNVSGIGNKYFEQMEELIKTD